jgi:hypothetical protein
MANSPLSHLEAVLNSGKAIISADDDTIVALVKETIDSGRKATFYLSSAQSDAVRSWFFTPERIRTVGMQPVSAEEAARIETELGIANIGSFRCNRIQCECGQMYGAFEFLQQGIREHGGDLVKAVFALDNFTMLNANRPLVEICPNCDRTLRADDGGIEYDCDDYGGCCYQEAAS